MKILIISDIHGNLPALLSVLENVQGYDKIFCLGDLAGYFPQVNEVVCSMVSWNNLICIKGNHDQAFLEPGFSTGSRTADRLIDTQREIALPSTIHFLASLPSILKLEINGESYTLIHGSPSNPLSGRDPFHQNPALDQGVYLSGHTHIPFYHRDPAGKKIFINPGSCGFPRDGDYRPSYALLETETGQVHLHRTHYAIEETVRACRESNLPENLIMSLKAGCWIRA